MTWLTLALSIPAQGLDDSVQLLADDHELLEVARRYRGWLLSHIGEKNLIARADALIAQQEICRAVYGNSYTPPSHRPQQGFSMLILRIPLRCGGDRELCATYRRYYGSLLYSALAGGKRERVARALLRGPKTP